MHVRKIVYSALRRREIWVGAPSVASNKGAGPAGYSRTSKIRCTLQATAGTDSAQAGGSFPH